MTVTLSRWKRAPLVFCSDLPDEAYDVLDDEMSYFVQDYEYYDSWQDGSWNGKHHLLRRTKKDNTPYFPVGLLTKATTVLDALGVKYEIEGLVRPGRGDMGFEWLTDKTLRDYQREAVDTLLQHGCGIIASPTGSGKTLCGLRFVYELQQPVLVVSHNTEVISQWQTRIERILGVTPAKYWGGDREEGNVMTALYQSLTEDGSIRDDVQVDHTVVIFDEVHRVGADLWSQVAMSIPAPYRLGASATPERSDGATLRVIGGAGPVVADLSPEKLIDEEYLPVPTWKLLKTPSSGGSYRRWQDEYTEEIVRNEDRNELIAGTVADLETPCLITVERINHGERLSPLIDDAAFVYGNAAGREENIQAFRDGELPVLIATRGIVGEGFDVENIRSFVVAGGLKSEVSTLQQVGRGMRYGETGEVTIVDFKDSGRWIGKHSEERIRTYRSYYQDYGP